MAKHPARPYEGGPIAPSSGSRDSHPARPYGDEGAGVTPSSSHGNWGRQGRKTPLGPMPTRSPEMTPPPIIGGDDTRG